MPTPNPRYDTQRFRSFLTKAEFTEAGFHERAVFRELPSLSAGNWPFLLDATRDASPFNVLARLFLFGLELDCREAGEALPESVLGFLLDTGMVGVEDARLVPHVMLTPASNFIVAADPLPRMASDHADDIVLWANQTTRSLEQFALRDPVRTTLDLGAGCGVISLLASPYSERVIATDLNPRAAEFVKFNAWLNGVTNIEYRHGDTFEPVAGLTFDRILANPPFFVTPSSSLLYCENPMELDSYCRRVIREGAERLNEGGFLQMMFEWVQVGDEPWQERLAAWVDGIGCDAWVLRTYAGGPAAYAYQRTREKYAASPEATTDKFDQWIAYYREHGVREIHGGLLAMRKRSGRNWIRIEEGRLEPAGPFGESVAAIFSTQDALTAHRTEEEMMELKPRLVAGVKLEQQLRAGPNGWTQESCKVTIEGSLPASLAIESQVVEFLGRCDGNRSLEELTEELTKKVKASPAQVRQQCCAVVKMLAGRRFLAL